MWTDGRGAQQRLVLFAGLALLLPVIVALVFQFSTDYRRREAAVERDALSAARELIALADARLAADLTGLRVLSASAAFASQDWAAALLRARDALRLTSGWKALTVTDLSGKRVLLDTAPVGGVVEPWFLEPAALALPGPTVARVGGVDREGRHCPCVRLEVPIPGLEEHVLTLVVDPHVYQDIVMGHLPPGAVAGFVDRRGLFLARSLDYPQRLGTPGTSYVLDAVARGGSGIYRGRTYEGLENYTAYVTSAQTGWSSHVAVDRSLIDGPRARYQMAIALGSIAALVIAAGMIGYAVLDLTKRRREEMHLIELQKVEAIGRFTGTVVHDFNNLLMVTQSTLNQIVRRSAEPETIRIAELGAQAIQRGSRLTNQLLSFARQGGVAIEPLDLAALLADTEELLRRSLGEGIALSVDVASDARWVEANRDQLELALVNLAFNARDAMDGEGSLTITARRRDGMIEMRVTDTGPGIPEHLRDRLFDAFVTTKPPGRGTGLGLAQVAGAVRQAGGSIEAVNGPAGGAVLILRLRPAKPEGKAADRGSA